jgi:O-antigen/teichoic acid export membrane protein
LRLGFVFLAWQTTSQVLGEYTAAFRILEVAYLVPAGVMGIGFPHLAESFGLGKRIFVVEIKRIALVMVGLALLWTSFLVLGGPLIIRLLFGARYEGAAPVLRYLGFAGGMVFLNFFVCHLMIVINRQKRHAFHEVLVFLICATLSIVWIPVHGAEGAAMALLGTEVSLFLLTTTYLWRKWEHTFPNLDSANMPAL